MATRSAWRKNLQIKKAMHTEYVDAAVLFSDDLMAHTLMYCTPVDQGRVRATCSAVRALDLSAPIQFAAGRLFQEEHPFAREEMLSWGKPIQWVDVCKEWRRIEKFKPPLTFKKNTRLAKDQRCFQTQYSIAVIKVSGLMEMEFFFDKGWLEMFGMNEDGEVLQTNLLKYEHNMAQWLHLLDDTSGTDSILVTHVCGRPLNSFKGLAGLKAFISKIKERAFFTMSLLALPDYDTHIPNECRIAPVGLSDVLYDDSLITI